MPIAVPDDPPEILLPLTLGRVPLFNVRPHPLDDLGWILLIPPPNLCLDDRVGNLASFPTGMNGLDGLMDDLMVLGREFFPECLFIERGRRGSFLSFLILHSHVMSLTCTPLVPYLNLLLSLHPLRTLISIEIHDFN